MKKTAIILCLCLVAWLGINAQTEELKRIPVKRVQQAMLNAPQQTWKESFEDWDGSSLFWLPEGWTAQRTAAFTDEEEPHTWAVTKQINLFYPQPVDGNCYAVCFYNDDAKQDEWLYSPEISPKDGDFLSYYVTLQPFFLFDSQYFDKTTKSFSQLVSTADLRLHISVDGGQWQQINSMFDTYKNEDMAELYEAAFMGYASNRKIFVDMKPYVGHKVKLAFQYVGQGGDSMYLDNLELKPVSMTTGYDMPEGSLFLGMTPDFKQPASLFFLPDNTPLTWTNTSSLEAQTFDWAYAAPSDYKTTEHKSTANLTVSYNSYVPKASQTTFEENIATVPVLSVEGVGGLKGTYSHPTGKMLIGGKAEFVSQGVTHQTGASYCDPAKGYEIMTTATGVPYFGVGQGNKELWTKLFGQEASVIGVGVFVKEPAKAWTMRGLHIQGVGKIEKAYKLRVTVKPFNVYGSVDETPLATAIIDADNIVKEEAEGMGEGVYRYTLPFLFSDPLTINRDVVVCLEGLPQAASWFAPLQTAEYEAVQEQSRAIFEYNYMDGGKEYTGMNYVSNLSTKDSEGNVVPCATNFFFNFDIAYGDHADWGHLDITPAAPEIPELDYKDNTIVVVNAETLKPQFGDDEITYKELKCGFYDESDSENLTLYICIGALYEIEGGTFYGEDVDRTYYYKLTFPKDQLGKGFINIDGKTVKAEYYDLLSHSCLLTATQGKLKVSETATHVYDVTVEALDAYTLNAMGSHYCLPDAWRMRDFTEERPNPSQFELKKNGVVKAHHDILSCVVDNSNIDIPVFYFADQPDLASVDDVLALNNDQYVSISFPASLMDGLLKGFSGWSNDDLTVTYKGVKYNHSGCLHDETCYGGNAGVVLYDTENLLTNVNSTVFTLISENMSNLYLHYEGPFVFDPVRNGISSKNADSIESSALYDLQGRRILTPQPGHLYIQNGRKVVMK